MESKAERLKNKFEEMSKTEEEKRVDRIVGAVVLDCLAIVKRKLALKKMN